MSNYKLYCIVEYFVRLSTGWANPSERLRLQAKKGGSKTMRQRIIIVLLGFLSYISAFPIITPSWISVQLFNCILSDWKCHPFQLIHAKITAINQSTTSHLIEILQLYTNPHLPDCNEVLLWDATDTDSFPAPINQSNSTTGIYF